MDNILKVLIVDDEKEARDLLEIILKDFVDIQIVGKASCVNDALTLSVNSRPDLVFLDVKLIGETGFDYASKLQTAGISPAIVFVTGFDKYALEAFKIAALHYIIKPPSFSDIQEVLERYKNNKLKTDIKTILKGVTEYLHLKKIMFNTSKGFILVDPTEIVYLEAEGNYTLMHLKTGKYEVITTQLGLLEKRLDPEIYTRINRSITINIKYLVSFNRKNKLVYLNYDNKEISFSISNSNLRNLRQSYS